MNEKVSGCWSDIYSEESIDSRHKECIRSFQNVNIFQRTWWNFLVLYHELEIPTVIVTAMPRKLSTLFYEHSWSSSLCIETEKTVMDLLYYWKNFIVSMSCVPQHLFSDDLTSILGIEMTWCQQWSALSSCCRWWVGRISRYASGQACHSEEPYKSEQGQEQNPAPVRRNPWQ